jgi:hypothetical protein
MEIKSTADIANEERDDRRASLKQKHQRIMAYTALAANICLTLLLFTPVVTESRIDTFASIADLFYLSMASIVGMFMGSSAYMSRK